MRKINIAIATGLALLLAGPVLAAPPGGLPPGLQKKAAHGNLPPGWQKKLAVGHHLDRDIYAHAHILGPVSDRGYITVEIEDRRLRLLAATLEIVDILN